MTQMFSRGYRQGEWQNAAITGWIGCMLLYPYPYLHSPSISPVLTGWLSEGLWGVVLIGVAIIRLVALTVNGRSPRGSPIARILSAWFGMITMLWLSLAFLHRSPAGLWAGGVYGIICAFEALSVFRAACDLRRGHDARK